LPLTVWQPSDVLKEIKEMKKIAIIGAGGFGREVQMLIEQINQEKKQYEFIGFFDDNEILNKKVINDFPVIGKIKDINNIREELGIILAIGNTKLKKEIINKINNPNIFFPTIIHPDVILGERNVIEYGNIITAGVILTTNIKIGKFNIINLACTIGHDVIIKDFCSFMPSVNISGEVIINNGVYIGTNATIINQKKIGKWATIGAGAVIIKDVPDGVTVVGNPGRILDK